MSKPWFGRDWVRFVVVCRLGLIFGLVFWLRFLGQFGGLSGEGYLSDQTLYLLVDASV